MTIYGEYKTTGGKLAAAALTLDGGVIASAAISGDFFINPEPQAGPVLLALGECLKGLPVSVTPQSLAARLRAAVPFGVELLGTSAEAIGIAVRRAIEGSHLADAVPVERIGSFSEAEIEAKLAAWVNAGWRILPEIPLSPLVNTALDEVLLNAAIQGAPPTLRFWRWSAAAIIIGRCQSVANEVDREAAAARGLSIVRRITGGGAMLLEPHGAITYSLYFPEKLVAGLSLRQSYELCDSWVIRGLRSLGVEAHHVPINDIACADGKIGGAAQARRGGAVLHHTTIAYDLDSNAMATVLRIGREKLKDKAVTSAAKRVSPLVKQTGKSREAVMEELLNGFRRQFGGTLSTLSHPELTAAQTLVTGKFATQEWLQA